MTKKFRKHCLKLPQQMSPVAFCVLIDKGLVFTEVKNAEMYYCPLILQNTSENIFCYDFECLYQSMIIQIANGIAIAVFQ